MKASALAVRVALLVVAIAAFAGSLQAQYRTSIQGVVTDSSGAVVGGATLTLTNAATSEKIVRTSGQDGVFNFNALASGATFRLEADKPGFGKKVLDNVALIPEQANAINVQLSVGGETTTVTVDASSAPALDTETASVNGVVTDNQIQHLPSFGRDVLKLSQLAPGSFGDGSQGGGGGDNYNLPGTQTGGGASGGNDGIFKTENGAQVIANGSQSENNGVSIDGISTTSAVWGGATIITPSEDSVDSVKIVSNSYDAESGRFSGAQIQITSKSGSNQFHGSAFLTTHSPGLNAYQPFNGTGNPVAKDNNHFNQLGGSLGGPIWKNKVFAFFNYETVREPNSNLTGNGWYETPAFAALAPAGSIAAQYLSFPGNGVINKGISSSSNCSTAGLVEGVDCRTIPGQGINVGTPLTTPLGTQDTSWVSTANPGIGSGLGNTADIANYITSNPTAFTAAQYNGRLDADVTGKDRLGFTIYYVPLTKTNFNGGRGYDFFHHNQLNEAFAGIWNHTFSPTLLNELRVNAASFRWNEVASNPQSPIGLPQDNIDVTGSITLNNFGPSVGSILNQWTYSYKDVATKVLGRNTIKFGGEATRLFYLQDCAGCGVPNYHFFNIWDFLNDAPHIESGGFNPSTGAPMTLRQDDRENIAGVFVQDDLKLRSNLTVNLGLRWSYFGPLYSKENNFFVAHPGAGSSYLSGLTVRRQSNAWDAQKNNFGPEIGFAWSPIHFNNKLVIRGGYGLNYNQEQIAISANVVNNPGLIVFPTLSESTPTSPNPGIIYATSSDPHNLFGYPTNPHTVSAFGTNGLPTTGQVGVQIFPNTLPTMRTHHYSLDTQYDLGRQFVLSLGYQGSISHNLFFHSNPNATPAASGFALNPNIGGGDNWGVVGHSNYNAMLVELKHQFSQQFTADAQFAWAKSLDTSSAPYSEQFYPYNPNLSYGRSDYNVTDAFKLFGTYQPIFFRGSKGWADKIAGGWSISGIWNWHSGFPWSPVVSVKLGDLYCGTCGYNQLLPAASSGAEGNSTSNKAYSTGSNFPGGGAAYFTTPAYTAYSGTASGNSLPQSPGVQRNSFTGPRYQDVDMTLAKAFGLPSNRVLGEGARLEFRLEAYNVFNTLNLNENNISNNIASPNFGQYTAGLAGRTVQIGGRFNF